MNRRIPRRGTARMARIRQASADRQAARFVRLQQEQPLPPAAPVSVVELLLAMGDGPVLTGPGGEPVDGQHRIAADGDR